MARRNNSGGGGAGGVQTRGADGGGGGTAEAERQSLDHEAQLEQVIEDLTALARRAVPVLQQAVARTEGTEGATIPIKIGYKAGGAKSKSRLEVTGDVKIPVGGFSREVTVIEIDGEKQLRMFLED